MKALRTTVLAALTAISCVTAGRVDVPAGPISPSVDVKNTVLNFYQRMRAGERSGFDEFISTDPSLLVIGSANEWYTEREKLRGVFRLHNQGLEAGADPIAYQDGDMGWFVDRPDWVFPDGSRMHTRFTAILHREKGTWKFVHWHLSVGVPDDEALALQHRTPSR